MLDDTIIGHALDTFNASIISNKAFGAALRTNVNTEGPSTFLQPVTIGAGIRQYVVHARLAVRQFQGGAEETHTNRLQPAQRIVDVIDQNAA